MFKSIHQPGAMVRVLLNGYEHYAIVSDRVFNGMPMLISLSARTGTVLEEAWDVCTAGYKVVLSDEQGTLPSHQVIAKARNMIKKPKWKLFRQNCEHFARWAHGLKVESKQVNKAIAGSALLFLTLCALKN